MLDEAEAMPAADAGARTVPEQRPLLLFLVTEDWYFCSHRLPAARAARDAGFRVAVATRVARHSSAIEAEGFELHPLPWVRRSLNPLAALRDVLAIARLYARLKPDVVHHVAVKPAVLGGIAAVLAGVPGVVTTLAGRGLLLQREDGAGRLAGVLLRALLRAVGLGRRTQVIVQNRDDLAWLGRVPATLIRGSGVPLDRFVPLPLPPEGAPFILAQVSRMLTIKGVDVLVEAVRRVRARGLDVRLILAGEPDRESHAAISAATLESWAREPGIEWAGHVGDVRTVWARAHLAVLASRGGEGVPMCLLEAAACGRPLLATDIPGSREVAQAGRNAILVPPADADALAGAVAALAADRTRLETLAAASRAVVDPDFGAAAVAAATVAVYRALLDR
ncbi:glycosyltransferase family 4 protein [Rhodospirillum centenum]|uniref:Glycosyl transferase, group 1 family protein n=1 Tax=Rhodospirillum centenum (strain ATCC 51521 / SW) TaxID=414684 RepID=B6IXS3_RHOCS|nr:glycosyltransferase family 4 protein [Rhodospirillum centenum]ACJ01097.1 glycosyl transferase, group 1 family protein [Rhodospirillum centenum SW]